MLHQAITAINKGIFRNIPYAEAIYVGIVTDTGNFDHGFYTGDTFRTIADLLDLGIEKERIFNLVFNNFSADRMRLQGYALNERMIILEEYGAAYIFLTKDDLKKYNYRKGDTEGFVNLPLSIGRYQFYSLDCRERRVYKTVIQIKRQFFSKWVR